MNNRIAIVTLSGISAGEAANVAALLCGQVSRADGRFFRENAVCDKDGSLHSAPHFSVVILKAKNPTQLVKLAHETEGAICFSRVGQGLNNAFAEYESQISSLTTDESNLVGVAIYGTDEDVRAQTRKFSLLS